MKPFIRTALVALAPASSFGPAAAEVAEIVTFRLAEGIGDAVFLEAAAGTRPFLETSGGFRRRVLSKGEDGRWTDHLVWSDLAAARAAAQRAVADPSVAPFLQAIDPATIEMRHEAIRMMME